MFGILVSARLRMLYNGARYAPTTQKAVVSGLAFLSLGLIFGLGFGTYLLVSTSQDTALGQSGALTSSTSAIVSKIYEYLFFFLLAGSVPFVATTMFQADDLNLLFTTPVVPRSVVGAKLVDAIVANGTQFMVLGVPVLVGLGFASKLDSIGWLWLVVGTLFLLVIPPTATAAVLLVAAKLLGMRQVRIVVMLVSIGLGLGITLLAIVGTNKLTSSGTINYHHLRQQIQHSETIHKNTSVNQVVYTDNAPGWMPSTWAFEILRDTSGGRELGKDGSWGFLRLAACCGLLVPFCLLLGQNVFSSEAFLETTDSSFIKPSSRKERLPVLNLLPVQLAGMVTKDVKYIKRDTILLGQIGTALILFLVPYLIRGSSAPKDRTTEDMYGNLALAMLLLITYMITSVVSLTSIGLEGKSGWIVLGGPISRGRLLRSKWLLSFCISLSIVTVLTMICWASFRWDWPTTIVAIGAWCCACFALSGLGVGLSGLFPRFIYENPAHRASVWALILGFYFSTGYIVSCLLVWAFGYLAFLRSLITWQNVEVIGVVCCIAISAVTGILPVTLAEKRLESYEWEH
jgi:hypothetical protein